MGRKKREMRTLAKAAILVRILKAVSGRARVYLHDPKKMQNLVTDADERALVVGEAGTMARQTLGYVGTMGRLGKAFVTRQYRAVPWGTLVGATAAVLYFVMPLDFIPDILAGMGLVDDAALIAFVAMQIRGDLEKFTLWERTRRGGAVAPETAAVDGSATPAVLEDISLETSAATIPPLPDATIERAADAVLDAVEDAQQEQAQLDELSAEARRAAKAAEKAARDAEKAAKKEARARKKAEK